MAAAYAYHICSTHPFEDGNKRAAVSAMVQFLADNGLVLDVSADEAEPHILRLAAGEYPKSELEAWVRSKTRPG
jgi:death-on-curing protein